MEKELKKALKAAGLSEELADVLNITSEDQIEGVIAKLKPTQNNQEIDFDAILGSQEFNDYVTEKGFDHVLKTSKSLQSNHDKKVTDGVKTFQQKYLKKINNEEDTDDKVIQGDDTPKWAQALIEKVDKLENEKTTSSKTEQARELLKKSKLPENVQEKWIRRINLDQPIEDQITTLEAEHAELFPLKSKGLPFGMDLKQKVDKEEVEQIADDIF